MLDVEGAELLLVGANAGDPAGEGGGGAPLAFLHMMQGTGNTKRGASHRGREIIWAGPAGTAITRACPYVRHIITCTFAISGYTKEALCRSSLALPNAL